MKLTCNEHEEFNGEWHLWFAWYPVRVYYGKKVWLEMIERRWITAERLPELSYFEYREVAK